jgi:hypothetical protein
MDLDAIFNQVHRTPTAAPQVQQVEVSSSPKTVDLDSIFSAVHGPAPTSGAIQETPSIFKNPIDALTSSDWWLTRPSGEKISLQQAVVGPALSAGNALTGNLLDEGISGVNAAIDTAISDKSFSDAYADRLTQARGLEKNFDQASPVTSIALDVAGMTRLPFISKIGQGATVAQRAVQAGKEGAALGALYGFGGGEGGFTDRAKEAGITGAVGGAAGLVATPLIEGAGALTRSTLDYLAEKGITPQRAQQAMAYLNASERGAIGEGAASGAGGATSFTPEELFVARQLKNTPTARISDAADEMTKAAEMNSPLFLPEALQSPKVNRNARFIANYEPSMEFSQTAIRDRADEAVTRAVNALDTVSPSQDIFENASKMAGAADDIITGAEKARQELVKPLYGKAYELAPEIKSPVLTELLEKDKTIQKAINSVKQTANNVDLPDTSTELLVKARHEVGNMIESAKAQGLGRKVRDLTDTYNRLNGVLRKENPALAAADDAYSAASKEIEALNDTFLSSLRNVSDDKITKVGQVFNLPAKRIEDLRNLFTEKGKLNEWQAGIRAHLQNTVEGTLDGRNFTNKITGNAIQREKLKAALGPSYEKVLKSFDLEDLMFQGKNTYNTGSSSYTNFEEANSASKLGQAVQGALKDPKGFLSSTVQSIFGPGMSDDLAQGVAKIYFDPNTGRGAINKIAPLLDDYARNKSAVEAATKAAEFGVTRGSPGTLNSIFRPQQQAQRQQGPQSQILTPRSAEADLSAAGNQGTIKATPTTYQPQSFGFFPPSSISIQDSYADNPKPSVIDQALSNIGDEMKLQKTAMSTGEQGFELPEALIKSVITQESSGNKKAVSKAGAQGLMQLMPATGREWHKKLGIEEPYDPFNPEQNRVIGTAYLKYLVDMYDGDLELALTAYNQGFGRVNKLLAKNRADSLDGIIDDLGPDGKKYAKMILKRMSKYEQVTA